ncbi:MAG: transposase [Candidatus Eisenbacteria bacterium]
MPRIARIVAPHIPHHVVQRGNRRQTTFFQEEDYRLYRRLMAEWCHRWGVQVWAYCLMPNHTHLLAVPPDEEALARAVGEAHRRYTLRINQRHEWVGCLWQGRFASTPMDEAYLLACARYVEMNPVRAGIVPEPGDYAWSSAHAHLRKKDDELVRVAPLLEIVPNWRGFLSCYSEHPPDDEIRARTRTGRPLGDTLFLQQLEETLDRSLSPQRSGPKPLV